MGASRRDKQKQQQNQQKGKGGRRNPGTKFFGEGATNRRMLKKLANVLKSNGPKAAKEWAQKRGATLHLRELAEYGVNGRCGDSRIARMANEALKA